MADDRPGSMTAAKKFSVLILVALNAFICLGQEFDAINFDQLRTNSIAEIERATWYGYTTLQEIKVLDYKLLGWYRIRDSRPHYTDNALCWAKTSTAQGTMWALAHMCTNPKVTDANGKPRLPWTLRHVADAPITCVLFFASTPKNRDVYDEMMFFTLRPEEKWEVYDSRILTNNWQGALGEKPTFNLTNSIRKPQR